MARTRRASLGARGARTLSGMTASGALADAAEPKHDRTGFVSDLIATQRDAVQLLGGCMSGALTISVPTRRSIRPNDVHLGGEPRSKLRSRFGSNGRSGAGLHR